ncbi:hypothetical protein BDR05DRAFT_946551 [Suillus weaverae]|nr:hypothetical protein BDR05DRAFT_946551 [Suillus weaverae]
MGPPVSIGSNIPPGPSVIIEDIHNMGPWSGGPYNTEFVTEGAHPPPKSKSLKTTGRQFLGKLFIQWLDTINKQGEAIPAASQPSCVDFDPAKLYCKIITEVISDTNFDPTQLQSVQLRCIVEETIISKAFLNVYKVRHLEGVLKFQSSLRRIFLLNLRDITHPTLFETLPLHSLNLLSLLLLLSQTLPTTLPILTHLVINAQLYLLLSTVSYFWMLEDTLMFRTCLDHWLLVLLRMTIFHLMSNRIKQCQCDIVQMIDVDTGKCVGGVIFNAFNDKTLQELHINHKAVAINPSKMVPVGSQLAKGGCHGDRYTTYTLLCGDSEDNIQVIFHHAHDADALLQSVKYAAHVAKNIKDKSAAAKMNLLGTSGATDEWNFCYIEWSAYIQTRANTVWWFDSNHLHGTMAPAASVIKHAKHLHGGALSTGNHLTVRERDRRRAHAIAEMHRQVAQREQWWEDVVM